MKKILVLGTCGLMLFAACVFAGETETQPKIAGSGLYLHVKV